jgi:hypothetical protein
MSPRTLPRHRGRTLWVAAAAVLVILALGSGALQWVLQRWPAAESSDEVSHHTHTRNYNTAVANNEKISSRGIDTHSSGAPAAPASETRTPLALAGSEPASIGRVRRRSRVSNLGLPGLPCLPLELWRDEPEAGAYTRSHFSST